ncbi:MAG: sulfatase family protein [Planctomycetota bacterium]
MMVSYTRRDFLKTLGLSAASFTIPGCMTDTEPSGAVTGGRPNIIFIMSDDHASHAISCYGSRVNRTPNIDRLAAEGMRFNNCLGVNSLCSPSRAAILTGKYPHVNGVTTNGVPLDGSQQTFPMLLQKAGYETAMIGKWHLGSGPRGFDYWNVLPGQGRYWDPEMVKMGKKYTHPGYLTDIITDESIRWLRERTRREPFLLLCQYKAAHVPHRYPRKYSRMYVEDLPEPATFDDDYASRSKALAEECRYSKLINIKKGDLSGNEPPEGLTGHAYKKWVYQTFFKGYLRVIAAMDESIGRLLDYIDLSGLAENTVVVYTSDNGFFLGDHGFYNKMWMYEQSLHMPLIVRYPRGIRPGAVNDDIVTNIDFAPTFLDYAGVTRPLDMQGSSLRALLQNRRPADWRRAMYYRYYGDYGVAPHYGIRTRRYKLIHFHSMGEWELFDLEKDPNELTNRCDDPEYAGIVRELRLELNRLQSKYGDSE